MGKMPAEVRAMTPEETELLISGWNEAQAAGSDTPPPMTPDRLAELEARYPDG